MSEPRVIKKYPNRRLYDTVESRYITLADVRRLVVEKIDFLVIDKKSQEDITRTILLQVITEQEHAGEPLMSRDFLSQVIRSYGGTAHSVLGSYLEQSLKLFGAQQRELKERIRSATGGETLALVAAMAERNYERWRSVQDDIFRTLVGAVTGRARSDDEAKEESELRAPDTPSATPRRPM
jgi:polyhydroxyalkanoate synthesis repressor PhaR